MPRAVTNSYFLSLTTIEVVAFGMELLHLHYLAIVNI